MLSRPLPAFRDQVNVWPGDDVAGGFSTLCRVLRSLPRVTVEEQSVIGGLGSACAEVLAENGVSVPFRRVGIPDQFCENLGDWTYTREQVGLTRSNVAQTIREMLKTGGRSP